MQSQSASRRTARLPPCVAPGLAPRRSASNAAATRAAERWNTRAVAL